MKKILSWAVILLMAMVGMTACNNDDDENATITPSGKWSLPDYHILSKNTYTKDEYKALLLKEFQKYIGNSNPFVSGLVNEQLNGLLKKLPNETQITIVNFECPSEGRVRLNISGQIIVPTLDNKIVKDTLVLDNRFTQLKDSEVPTKSLNVGAVLAVTGCPVVTCDMLGYGSSKNEPLNYHCYEASSRNTVDAALAGIAILRGPELGLDISDEPLPVYNEGYSQGGYGALSVLKYLEADRFATAFEQQQLPLLKTVCGAGAYDPVRMLDVIIDNAYEQYPYYCYIAAAFATAYEYHESDYSGVMHWDDSQNPWLDVFTKEAYKAGIVSMTTSRHYNTSEIMRTFFAKMKEITGKDEIVTADVLSSALICHVPNIYDKIIAASKKESLVEGWVPKSRLHFYHAKNDEAVPVQCAYLAAGRFGDGPHNNITYDIDTNVTKLLGLLEIKGLTPHTMGYFNFMIQTVLADLNAKPEDKK